MLVLHCSIKFYYTNREKSPTIRQPSYEQAKVARKNSLSTKINLKKNQTLGRAAICQDSLGWGVGNRTKDTVKESQILIIAKG